MAKKEKYFTKETEKKIVEYIELTRNFKEQQDKIESDFFKGKIEKEKYEALINKLNFERDHSEEIKKANLIYEKYIYYPFKKICENIINKYSFLEYSHLTLEQLETKTQSFMFSKIHKYKKNGNAFGYFSVICKNFLIHLKNNNYKDEITFIGLEDHKENKKSDSEKDRMDILDEISVKAYETEEYKKQNFDIIKLLKKEIEFSDDFEGYKQKKVISAFLEILNNVDSISKYHKKKIFILLRERSAETQ